MNSAPRSFLTKRSPLKSTNSETGDKSDNESEGRVTRLQVKRNITAVLAREASNKEEEIFDQTTPTTSPKPYYNNTAQYTTPNTIIDMTNNKMNALQIQQLISTSIPEFSGVNNSDRHDNMTRFIASADNIYKSLQTEDEHKTFNRLVRLRLTNEAFNRINNKNPETYLQMKQMIEDMYTETYSLEQLENKYLTTQQTYGESIRNYGFRLQDALEKYKQGYRIKYDIPRTDESYNKHLQINAVKTFKRGLNNTILKDKISLSTANSIDEIVRETEKIESMLLDTNVQSFNNNIEPIQASSTTQITHYQHQSPIIICNYCNKPNHTYDKCRTRISNETNEPRRFNQNATPQQRNWYNQPSMFNQPTKYCSHCKTTRGHTFEECRNKFKQNAPQTNFNYQPPQNNYNRNYFNQNQQTRNNNYQKPWNNYPQYQHQDNNHQKPWNYTQYQPQNNDYGNQQNYSRYKPQNNTNHQSNYSPNRNNNQPLPAENFRTQNREPTNESNTQNPNDDLNNMMRNMTINNNREEQETRPQYNNQGNFNGSNQN